MLFVCFFIFGCASIARKKDDLQARSLANQKAVEELNAKSEIAGIQTASKVWWMVLGSRIIVVILGGLFLMSLLPKEEVT